MNITNQLSNTTGIHISDIISANRGEHVVINVADRWMHPEHHTALLSKNKNGELTLKLFRETSLGNTPVLLFTDGTWMERPNSKPKISLKKNVE